MATNDIKRIEITRPTIDRVDEVFQSDDAYINMFYKELSNLDTEIPFFYKNFKTLTFENDDNLYSKIKSEAYYYPEPNKIVTNSKDINLQLSHELLHMASSTVEGDIIYIGFHQTNKKDGYQIGEALNEGFTNSLDNRLFENLIPGKKEIGKKIYPITTRICDNLEFTLETKRMLDCYFNADLKTIYNYLSRLMGKDTTLKFLYSFDALFRCGDECFKYKPRMLRLLYPDIQLFVAEALFTKTTDQYRIGTIGSNAYKAYLDLVKALLQDRITIKVIPITPNLKEAYPYIEERYNIKYKIREKNNCLVK